MSKEKKGEYYPGLSHQKWITPIYSYNFELDAEKIIATGAVARDRNFDRRSLTAVSLPQAIGRRSSDRPDKPLEEHHASGRQLREDQVDHPGYVKGAEASKKDFKQHLDEFSAKLLKAVQVDQAKRFFESFKESLEAEIEPFTKHSGVTDAMRGVKPKKPDVHLEADNWKHRARAMTCSSCMYYVPKVTPPRVVEGDEFTLTTTTTSSKLGRCRRRAPTLNGWPAMFESDWCGDHKLDEAKV